MEAVILGSGTCFPEADRGPSGYAVRAPEGIVLLDGGAGTTGRLLRSGLDFHDVGSWLFTHRHPDHTGELVPFLFYRKYGWGEAPRRPLEIRGGPGFTRFFDELMESHGRWCLHESGDVVCRDAPEGSAPFDALGMRVRAYPVEHLEEAVAYRLEGPDGATLCYSGDTGPCPGIVEAARGADVLLVECSLPDDRKVAKHLSPSEVARIVREAAPRRVVLVHVYPTTDRERIREACQEALGRPVELAQDGMRLAFDAGPGATS